MKRHDLGDRRKLRRAWSLAEKRRIVAETLEPGASVSVVARRHDVNANQVFKWRRDLASGDGGALPALACEFVPLGVVAENLGHSPALHAPIDDGRQARQISDQAIRAGLMEIELGSGGRVRVDASVDERALCRVLRALRQSA